MLHDKNHSFPAMLKDAVLVGAVSTALALPLVGFKTVDRTTQIELVFRFGEMFYAIAVITVGRLLLNLTAAGLARPVLFVTAPVSVLWLINYWLDIVPDEWPELAGLTWLAATIIAIRAWVIMRRETAADAAAARELAGRPIAAVVTLFSRFGRFLGPAAAAFAILMPFMPFADQRLVDIGILILTYIMLGWGLNVVVGLAGLLDLGYVAFYAVGAYSYALLSIQVGLNFWEALPIAGACAATFGILLGFPVLRLRGDYLAIVTLGFGEMVRLVLLNGPDFGLLANGAKGIGAWSSPPRRNQV